MGRNDYGNPAALVAPVGPLIILIIFFCGGPLFGFGRLGSSGGISELPDNLKIQPQSKTSKKR